MLRRKMLLFVVVTLAFLGGVILLYGQRTGKLTIFGDVPNVPGQLTISSPVDLQKGIDAGDKNLELVENMIKLKKNTQFSKWTNLGVQNPTEFMVFSGFRAYPLTTSFDEVGKKFFVHRKMDVYTFDSTGKSWQKVGNNVAFWASWSNKLKRIVGLQGTGNLQTPSNVVSLDANGGGAQVLGSNLGFMPEHAEALYHDSVSDMLVGVGQINVAATGEFDSALGYTGGACLPGTPTTGISCGTPVYPKYVHWFDIGSKQYNVYQAQSSDAWPEPRVGGAAAYDPVKKEILFFGGFTVGAPNFSNRGLTHYTLAPASLLWAFDTNTKTWSQRIASNQPPGRAFSKITYDQKNKRFVMFGGLTNLSVVPGGGFGVKTTTFSTSNDLWAYDPAANTWQQVNITTPPEARFGHGFGYDSVNHTLLAFAGQKGATTQATNIGPPQINDAWQASASGYPTSGTCQLDLGGAQITKLYRIRTIKPADFPASTGIKLAFAGSLDGLSYSGFSTPVTLDSAQNVADSFELANLIPANSRFVRVQCTLESSDPTATPSLGGLILDYESGATPPPPGTPNATLSTSKSVYAPGETVAFTFTNTGTTDLTCPNKDPYVVRQGETKIFEPAIAAADDPTLSPAETRSWNWDQKNTAGVQVPVGAYILTVTCDQITRSAAFTIADNTPPPPPPGVFKVEPTSGVAPLEVTATYTGTEANLVWDFDDGATVPVAKGPSTQKHTFSRPGIYNVTLRGATLLGRQSVTVTAPASLSGGTSAGGGTSAVLINGTTPGTNATLANSTTATDATKPTTLVSTGNPAWLIGLIALWIAATVTIFASRHKIQGA
ncbi:PKD domain-containing protein [Candidatus Berkelbacteria bacterium]|nr:PKD domain-containing protein [Candidatus Berkelbacteria bacterium]